METRFCEIMAIMMIGDGVIGVLQPCEHVSRWADGPEPWRQMMTTLAERPQLVRAASLVKLALGIAWVFRLPANPALPCPSHPVEQA